MGPAAPPARFVLDGRRWPYAVVIFRLLVFGVDEVKWRERSARNAV